MRVSSAFLLAQSQGIIRRFFVTNGFDGALTMIGLFMGFYLSGEVSPPVAIKVCLGAAIALFMSGVTSAYISESAERQKEIRELEGAMVGDLSNSQHARAARVIRVVVALVNGFSPLLVSLFVMLPLWLTVFSIQLPFDPYLSAIGLCLLVIFLFGVYLSQLSRTYWLVSGLRTLGVALVTLLIIYLVSF